MSKLKQEEVQVEAMYLKHTETGTCTIFAKGYSPVISGKTLSEAKKKFEEAMNLDVAIKNLFTFKTAVNAPDKKPYLAKLKQSSTKISFNYVSAE